MTIVIWRCDDLGRFFPDDGILDEPVDCPLCNTLASFKMRSKSSGIANDWKHMQKEFYSGLKKWWGVGISFLHLYKYINRFPSNNIYTYMVVHTLRYACYRFQLETDLTTVWLKGQKNTRWTVGRLKGQKYKVADRFDPDSA